MDKSMDFYSKTSLLSDFPIHNNQRGGFFFSSPARQRAIKRGAWNILPLLLAGSTAAMTTLASRNASKKKK